MMPTLYNILTAATIIAIVTWPQTACGFLQPLGDMDTKSKHYQQNQDIAEDIQATSRWGTLPYLAVLTEPDACSSIQRVEETIQAIDQATLDGGVNLVVIRVTDSSNEHSLHTKWALLKSLAEMKRTRQFILVVNDDVDIVLKALSQNIPVDGLHVKEHNAHLIPTIRSKLEHISTCSLKKQDDTYNNKAIIIGTSCHSIQSARKSYELSPRGPDYLFVGTCYLTQSHPEKESVDLEGPSLPGKIKKYLYQLYYTLTTQRTQTYSVSTDVLPQLPPPPIIFAIGGIDKTNCHEPVLIFGADGVATIRTIMQASDPREAVKCMKKAMKEAVKPDQLT